MCGGTPWQYPGMEKWKDIPGYEGYYQVSDAGRVRSLDREITNWCNGGQRKWIARGQILKQTLDPQGRWCVFFTRRGAKKKTLRVSTLVAEAFIGPRPVGLEVCHEDDDKDRNEVGNLYWGTREQNFADAVRNGHTPHGENSGHSKLTNEQVIFIFKTKGLDGHGCKRLSRKLGVSPQVINSIRNGTRWWRVTKGVKQNADAP